jgi:hypothetical protein
VQTGRENEAYMLLSITVMIAFASVWCSEWLLHPAKAS